MATQETAAAIAPTDFIIREISSQLSFTPAATKVFGIPELLENILLHLGIIQLFQYYRVNKTFKKTLESSHHLQRAMFLRHHTDRRPEENMLNPLINECLPVLYCAIIMAPDGKGGRFTTVRGRQCYKVVKDRSMVVDTRKESSWRQCNVSTLPKVSYFVKLSGRKNMWDAHNLPTLPACQFETLGAMADWLVKKQKG